MTKHLSHNEVQKLHMQLLRMRTELLNEIQTAQLDIKAVLDALEDEGRSGSDASELTRLEELRRSEIEIAERQLSAVEEAERRINEGHYGVCVECGNTIASDRLFALPTAIRCIECEDRSLSELD